MSGKMKLILLAAMALVSFGVSLFLGMKLGGSPAAPAPTTQPAPAHSMVAGLAQADAALIAPKERELDELIREVRAQMAACKERQRKLDEREQRLQIAQQQLDKQAQDLENLRAQLVAPLARLKEAQSEMERSRVVIAKQELENLKKTAMWLDKMDAAAGGEMLVSMCRNRQEDDVAKLLLFVSERQAGKLLAEIPDKALVATLMDRLKRIKEEG